MVAINIIFILIFVKSTRAQVDTTRSYRHRPEIFRSFEHAKDAHLMLKDALRTFYETSVVKIGETREMRFMYEETPHYEQGYVLGEIIERYRKVVEHVQRSTDIRANTVMDDLKRTELIQKLHFEIYHLCGMFHEIPLKYESVPEFSVKSKGMSLESIWAMEQNLKWQQKKLKKEKKKRLKLQKKLRDVMGDTRQVFTKKPRTWWPIEYGWEIDYYW